MLRWMTLHEAVVHKVILLIRAPQRGSLNGRQSSSAGHDYVF